MTKKQHYMTRDERHQLEAMHRNRIPVAEIARQLGFCRQTIYDELKRGPIRIPALTGMRCATQQTRASRSMS